MKLELVNVSKTFKDTVAVDHLNLQLSEGVYGLLGANGAGKTTLMRMICTLLKPNEGQILFQGEDIFMLDEHYRDNVGYLPQKFGYYPDFTGYDFLMYIASLKGFYRKEAKDKVLKVLELVHLSDVKKKKINSYSGGMIQRLGIAQAILNDPKILILDEPTAGLDPKERIHFRNIISSFSQHRIVILSTHIVSDVESIANEILLIKKGKILSKGSVEEILSSIQNAVYEVRISIQELKHYQQQFCISNIRYEQQDAILRIVDKHHHFMNAIPVEPTLEDLYLYEFREEMQDNETI